MRLGGQGSTSLACAALASASASAFALAADAADACDARGGGRAREAPQPLAVWLHFRRQTADKIGAGSLTTGHIRPLMKCRLLMALMHSTAPPLHITLSALHGGAAWLLPSVRGLWARRPHLLLPAELLHRLLCLIGPPLAR